MTIEASQLSGHAVIAGFGVLLLFGTVALLRQENRKFAVLTARRHALAQQLKAKDPS